MAKTTKAAKAQGVEAAKKVETKITSFEGLKKFEVKKDFARVKKGQKVEISFKRAQNWRAKGLI